jgi:hypothetical protein
MTAIDPHKLDALDAEVDALVEEIADAVHAQDDEAVIACEQKVDALLAAIDALIVTRQLLCIEAAP